MAETTRSLLSDWESFYVIVGSASAVLIGLQFVVVSLISGSSRNPEPDSLSAFGTPTVVHLAMALLVAAVMTAPWTSLVPVSIALALCGLGGLAYAALVFYRAGRQTSYEPYWEDWAWHIILPCLVYSALAVAAILLRTVTEVALFSIGAAALSLVFIAIHNAWDAVTYMVIDDSPPVPKDS